MGTPIDTTQRSVGASVDAIDSGRRRATLARHQRLGFLVLGVLLALTAVASNVGIAGGGTVSSVWLVVASAAGAACLLRSHRRHRRRGADRAPAPYVGLFAVATVASISASVLGVPHLAVLPVVVGVAAVLAVMAWMEQSAVGMTASVCLAVLGVGYGLAVVDHGDLVDLGALVIGFMLVTGSVSIGPAKEGQRLGPLTP